MLSVAVLTIILVSLFFAWFGVFIFIVKYYSKIELLSDAGGITITFTKRSSDA